jgi:putative phosphoribosyl transferase
MRSQVKRVLQNREHAGRLLAEKLYAYKNSDAIVLAVPQGGVPVGLQLAKALNVPFDIVFSKRIRHPANSDVSVGAVCLDEVVLQESANNLPQSYILHQINLLQRRLRHDFDVYYSQRKKPVLTARPVILVDDVLRDQDELAACIEAVKKENPSEIIIAVPVATSKLAHLMFDNSYRVVCLFMEFTSHNKAYTFFPPVGEDETTASFVDEHVLH